MTKPATKQTKRSADRERAKARFDMGAFGTGVVFVSDAGRVSHMPLKSLYEPVNRHTAAGICPMVVRA
jgi:hypothetical protein